MVAAFQAIELILDIVFFSFIFLSTIGPVKRPFMCTKYVECNYYDVSNTGPSLNIEKKTLLIYKLTDG